jgi:phenylpropionate dioxygenase-like ring-hydroxylating dioxygenase large terminal subunit
MFLSHINSINPNSYKLLEQCNNKKVLVNDGKIKIVSNICPHQQSLISTASGLGNRICPYHNWSFTISGIPIGSGRTGHYCKNENSLPTEEVYEWNSLLFDTPVNFNITEKFNNMILMETRIDSVNSDYRNVMDLFLDVDHISTVHKGVYDLIGITNTNVDWKYYVNGSVQAIEQGAIWMAVYPYTMIEWQQGSLFITVSTPNGPKSNVHIFKYTDANNLNKWKLNESVWEPAWAQDKAQSELITEFACTNLEPQKLHFREFLNGLNKK